MRLQVLTVFFTHVSVNVKLVDVKKQRTCIKFCFKLNKTMAVTHLMLKEVLVRLFILKNDVCNYTGLSYETCKCITADELNIRRIAAKFVPCLLRNDQWNI